MATVNIYDMADTWNDGGTTFTAIKMTVTDTSSASGSLLMDLKVGASSALKVRKQGQITFDVNATTDWVSNEISFGRRYDSATVQTGGALLNLSPAGDLNVGFGNSASYRLSNDVILSRKGAANLQLGAADVVGPVAQTLSVQSVVAGTTNTAGQNFTIKGSAGTGSGAGGSIIFQVAPAGGSGTGQNTLEQFAEITSGRALNLYNTFTDSTNFERGFIKWDTNLFTIGTEAGASGGNLHNIVFKRDTTTLLELRSTSALFRTDILMNDGDHLTFGTSTGSYIASTASQKFGFWGATPVAQPTTGISAGAFVANTSGISDDTATFDGYTIGQVVAALRQIGLLA